jgi:hypothetical protein
MDLIAGAWDAHVHAAPSLFPRWGTARELAEVCRQAGMAGIVLKSHHGSSVEVASTVGEGTPGLEVFGGVVLNGFVGGLNPFAVESCLALGGKIVWLPTIHAAAHGRAFGSLGAFPFQQARVARQPAEGIRLLDDRGRPQPALTDVLDVMNGQRAVLATGHASAEEVVGLVAHIHQRRLRIRLLLNHVFFKVPALSVDQLRALQSDAVWFETAYFTVSAGGGLDVAEVAGRLRSLPDAQWVMVSDSGQPANPRSPDALAGFARGLIDAGLDAARVRRMLVDEPRRLLA